MTLNKIIKDTTAQTIKTKLDTIKTTIEQLPTRPLLTSINDIDDVNIDSTTLSNDQILKYDSNTGKWINGTGGSGSSTWGNITGTLSDQTDLKNELDNKVNKVNAIFSEKIQTVTSSAITSINCTNGNVVNLTITINTTLSFIANTGTTLTLIITDGDKYTITWPTNIIWLDGSEPKLSSFDLVTLFYDGTNWISGSNSGGGSSSPRWGSITGDINNQTDLQTALKNNIFRQW